MSQYVPTSSDVEKYLLDRGDWVSTAELCSAFGLPDDRPLRQIGEMPGLCSGFAISGNNGFKHVALATRFEWLHFKHRVRRHGIGELVRVRDLDRRRQNVVRHILRPPPNPARALLIFERDTGQALLPLVTSTVLLSPRR